MEDKDNLGIYLNLTDVEGSKYLNIRGTTGEGECFSILFDLETAKRVRKMMEVLLGPA